MEGTDSRKPASKKVLLSSRTSVQSEPVVSSLGKPFPGKASSHRYSDNDIHENASTTEYQPLKWKTVVDYTESNVETDRKCGIECGFCEQNQVNPKLLPCLHSFCKDCLQKLLCIRNGYVCNLLLGRVYGYTKPNQSLPDRTHTQTI